MAVNLVSAKLPIYQRPNWNESTQTLLYYGRSVPFAHPGTLSITFRCYFFVLSIGALFLSNLF